MSKRLKNAFLKRIEETNELFNNSTPEQKRVMIAQDVIDRIKSDLLVPKVHRVIKVIGAENVNKENVNTLTCEVCAKGGLLASYVGRVNKFDEDCHMNNAENNVAHQKLLEIFTLEQLAIIEYAFEGGQYIHSVNIPSDLRSALFSFYSNILDPEERLIAICENIITNNGDFVL